ncbi:MAG: Fe-S cluster assembly protein SufD [Bacteroidetes bacterium]|jgi:Fe-S cluster assembly protein SufD|nr:Fe-S cluster assembly protein SufD [Bacteroidota bacterium]MDA1199207.1 Fe-S cluster assembly protein SufD [Bacteroidota bacterium]NDA06700.1 Fe-S cluster assembly protein SufD [Flavobacteriia bacterium]
MKERLAASYWLHESHYTALSSPTVTERRRAAMERFEAEGFPTVRHEDWKYTPLKKILKEDYALSSPFSAQDDAEPIEFKDIKRYLVNDIDCYRVVFINGRYSAWLSETTHQGFDVCTLGSAWKKYKDQVEPHFGRLTETLGATVQLNTALAWDGLYVRVPDHVTLDKPIQALYFTTGDQPMFTQTRSLILLGEGAKAEIIERHQSLTSSASWTNAVDEVFMGAQSHLHWVKLQHDEASAALTQHSVIEQKRDSHATVHTISTDGKFLRNNLDFKLTEPGAESRMFGLSLADGQQLVDHHTRVDHLAPHCTSRENYKGIFDGQSNGVFNGQIHVHVDAQKTLAFQENDNLILSEKASIDTKPQLEIFADDVKCSHGCTVGQLDEDALFYLRARGIQRKEAQALLMLAFAHDAVADIQHPSLQAKLHRLIGNKLGVDMSAVV